MYIYIYIERERKILHVADIATHAAHALGEPRGVYQTVSTRASGKGGSGMYVYVYLSLSLYIYIYISMHTYNYMYIYIYIHVRVDSFIGKQSIAKPGFDPGTFGL